MQLGHELDRRVAEDGLFLAVDDTVLAQLVAPLVCVCLHRDTEDVLPQVVLEPRLLLTEADGVRSHSLEYRLLGIVVEVHAQRVDDALLDVDVVVSEAVEVLVVRKGVALDTIHLMVHLTVRLRGGGAREEDDVATTDEVAYVLGPLAGLGKGAQPMGFVQDDEVPVLVGQLVHALVVDGEELVARAQEVCVLADARQRLLLGQEEDPLDTHLLGDR